jgi:hypothetical protein
MEKLPGSVHDLKSLYTADGPNNLLISILIPHHQSYYAINVATEATTNPAAQWTANAEEQFDGDYSIRTKFTAPGFENLVMTASNGDVEDGSILGGTWSAHPTQKFRLIIWSGGHYSFVTLNGLAVQPASVGVKGSPLILKRMNNRPGPGQLWASRT